jgi:lipocalin-like protein
LSPLTWPKSVSTSGTWHNPMRNAYRGSYDVDKANRVVTHIPSVDLLPSLTSGRQVRAFEVNGDRLTLRTAGIADADGVSLPSHLE